MEKSTQPPSFSDLPTEILFKILEELDPIHRIFVSFDLTDLILTNLNSAVHSGSEKYPQALVPLIFNFVLHPCAFKSCQDPKWKFFRTRACGYFCEPEWYLESENLEVFEFGAKLTEIRFIVRQVSKSLRSIVDAQKPKKWHEIGFQEDLNGIKITLKILFSEEYEIRFAEKRGGATVISGNKEEIYLKGANHLSIALNFLAPILSQRNREIGHSLKLSLENDSKIFDKFVKFIDFLAPRKLNIFDLLVETKFEIPMANLLSKIDTRQFGILQIKPHSYKMKIGNYKEILETEVFKNALGVSLVECEPLESVLVEKFLHLQFFQCRLKKCSMEELLGMREKLSLLKQLKDCQIRFEPPLDMNEVAATFQEEIDNDGDIYHEFPIPNSEFHLHFRISSNIFTFVHIEKRKNE